MSEKKTYNICCPQCNAAQDVELTIAFQAGMDNDDVQAVMENRLNRIQCCSCDTNFRVDMPVLYSDRDNGLLVHWIPIPEDGARGQVIEEFEASMEEMMSSFPEGATPPRIRLVFNRIELVELIFLTQEEMDERVIEYIKYTIYTRNREKVPFEQYRLLLNLQDSTAEDLIFVAQDVKSFEFGQPMRYGRAAYTSLSELYCEASEEFAHMFPGPYISARYLLLEEGVPKE